MPAVRGREVHTSPANLSIENGTIRRFMIYSNFVSSDSYLFGLHTQPSYNDLRTMMFTVCNGLYLLPIIQYGLRVHLSPFISLHKIRSVPAETTHKYITEYPCTLRGYIKTDRNQATQNLNKPPADRSVLDE